jgi:hypothetical protein
MSQLSLNLYRAQLSSSKALISAMRSAGAGLKMAAVTAGHIEPGAVGDIGALVGKGAGAGASV